MSNPSNPLSVFRTYAYHQFLAVTDSSTTADALSQSDEISDFRSNFETDFRDRFIERTEAQTGGSYVVLIDGLSDALFSIKSAKWMSFLQPTGTEAGLVDQASAELDGELTIVEPQGVNFLNELAQAADTLRSDPNGLVFVLKTIFVGQLPNGQVQTISNIRALTFVMFDITAIIDYASTEYTLSFVGAVNGAGYFPYVQQVARGRSISVTPDKTTIETALDSFATVINDHWESQRSILQQQADKSERAELQGLNFETDFRPVVYKITPDAAYRESRFKVGSDLLVQAENKGTSDAIIQPGPKVGIVEFIKRIMDSSQEIKQEGQTDNDGKRHIYKIYPVLQSTPDEYIVEYFVKRYEITPNPFEQLFENQIEPEPGQFIEFDYIFTGRNTDIINFDMKMQMGLAFFQTLGSSNNILDTTGYKQGEKESATAGTGGPVRAGSTAATTRRDRTPLFLGMTLDDPLFRHVRNPLDTITFQSLLSRWAGYENITATLKIHGNPQLLDELTPLPSDMNRDQITEALEPFGGAGPESGGTVNPKWPTRPGLVKINIKMPAKTEFGLENQTFWYDGFYNMYAVNHEFDDGIFTQDLELFSIIIDDDASSFTDAEVGVDDVPAPVGTPRSRALAEQRAVVEAATPTATPIGGPVAPEAANVLTNEVRRAQARRNQKGEERSAGQVITARANLGTGGGGF